MIDFLQIHYYIISNTTITNYFTIFLQTSDMANFLLVYILAHH